MKQPDLGRKISELRLEKGLTQSELAEKCNLSLRTIQRIETAEVTPRSYSVKLIFKSLDYEINNSLNKDSVEHTAATNRLEQLYRYVLELFNLKTNSIKKALILALLTCMIALSYFVIGSKKEIQSATKVSAIIKDSQENIVKWINSGQIDAVLSKYRDDACVLQRTCGKESIRKVFDRLLHNGYKITEYNIVSISVSDSIAVEKYNAIYTYKGKTGKQIGMFEWRFSKGKWQIVNDMYNEN